MMALVTVSQAAEATPWELRKPYVNQADGVALAVTGAQSPLGFVLAAVLLLLAGFGLMAFRRRTA